MRTRLLVLLLLLFCLTGCTRQHRDLFAPLRGEFSAELHGTLYGVEFAALLEADAPCETGGTRTATLTFYAPTGLADTVLVRNGDGTLTFRTDDSTIPAPQEYGYLFSLLLEEKTVTGVTAEDGMTCVTGEGFSLSFDSEGALTDVRGEHVSARVLSFAVPSA